MKYPTCKLSNVISPGIYCVVSTDKEHVLEVLETENNMKKEMFHDITPEFELTSEMYVTVRNVDKKLKRGVIEKKVEDDLYQVLLIDYGQVVYERKPNIRVITNLDFMKVEPLAFIVKLYGIIAAKYVFMGTIRKPKVSKEWRPEAKEFVENLLKDTHKIVVQSILIEHRTVYGDLLIQPKPKMKFVSLRKLLCKNEFCVYSESHFLRQENLDICSDSSELERKMEFVEKWRRENFEIQRGHFQISAPAPSSNSSKSNITSLHLSSPELTCEETEQAPRMSDQEDQILESPPPKPKTLGRGRGKIKLLIAEMKKKVEALDSNTRGSFQEKPCSKPEARVSIGRGQFLKKYLELKKSLKSEIFEDSTPVADSRQVRRERFSEVERLVEHQPKICRGVGKLEKATVRAEAFSDFGDSHGPTDVSLSTEENVPSLVGKLGVNREFGSAVLSDCQGELDKSSSDKKARSIGGVDSREDGERASSLLNQPTGNLESSKVPEDWPEKSAWEHAANQVASNNCWTPYVRFDDCVIEPAKTFGELRIQASVIKNLERGGPFSCLSQVQRWTIPAIRKQLNTITIGSPKTGKTLSYVVPLMDYVQDESYFDELPQGNGPSVVIVASGARTCESIYYLCHSLLGNYTRHEMSRSKVKIVLAHGGGCEKDIWVTLTNGCDVLISTPHCLARLLEMPVLTNLERLTCLVLDEVDVISQNPFRKSVRIILEKARFGTKNRYCQKIFCGEQWTPSVENLVKTYVESYALIIGSYSEAVIYEGLKPSVYLVDQNQKKDVLLDKLKDLIGKCKIVIVCEEIWGAVGLREFLAGRGIPALLAHEKMMTDKLKDIRAVWKSSQNSVLVITDGVLSEMNIREAQALIHYDLPNKSKTNFYLRYFTFENFLRDQQNFPKTEDKGLTDKLQDVILIDDENHYQLPHIIDFVVRLGGKISTKILDKCQEIRRVIEVEKCNSPTCGNLLAFGRCRNLKGCPQRHAFVEPWDSRGHLPGSGWVNFVVLRTHDASCFSVRLLEHVDCNGKTSKVSDCCLELSLRVSEFYKTANNRRAHGMPKMGDICAVKVEMPEGEEVFYRAKIIEYLKVDKHDKPLEVRVKLIDEGDVWKRKSIELYELPEELSKYPPTAVDVRVVGLQPVDFDVSWSEVAVDFTRRLLTQKLEEHQFWSGRIVLALNDTLFLDPIKRKQFLPQLNTHVFDLVVRDELLNNRVAVANDEHLPSLLKLCSEGKIEVVEPEEVKSKEEDSAVIQPQWAFLDATIDFISVKFLAAENTSTVFLQNQNFEKLLQRLEEDCQKEGERTRGEISAGTAKGLTSGGVAVGAFCLALFDDGKWNRGRIESEKGNEYFVYFVDHGDFLSVNKSDVVPISRDLLLRLPCQAIECNLVGVEEKEECSLEVLEKIYAFSDDGKKDLRAWVVIKDLKANVTGGQKYSLNLTDKTGVSLNKMLVDCGMVEAKESEKEHLQNMAVEGSDDDGSDGGDDQDDEDEERSAVGDVVEEGDSPDLKLSEDYVLNLTEDMFEDRIAQEFLREFARKVFNFSESHEGSVKEENKENTSPKAILNTPPDTEEESVPKRGRSGQNVKELLELPKNGQNKMKKELQLKSRGRVFTPQVLWCQNQIEVEMKILLGNVKDYSMECTVSNISFRCFLGDKFYAVDLRLYGAINPQLTRVTLKTFHVVVVLTKLTFPLWPRLQMDEGRLRWINLDVESLTDKEDIFSDKIRSAKLEIESGALKKGVRTEAVLPCSDSEGSNSCEVSSSSEDDEP